MLNYALTYLIDGPSLPGLLLLLLPVVTLYAVWRKRFRLFGFIAFLFFLMSLPVTGKLLLLPLETGTLYEELDQQDLKGQVQAVAVISGGLYEDSVTRAVMPSTSTFSRLKRAELLARDLKVLLIVSGTDQFPESDTEIRVLTDLLEDQDAVLTVSGASGTGGHARQIAGVAKTQNIETVAAFISGNHALRLQWHLEAAGIEVPVVVVGLRDSVFEPADILPSFIGFFYWKHALKEYAGLARLWFNGF